MLQIRLLGQFDLRLDGKRVTISSRAGQSLLAYIALTAGTPHRREKLAGLIWPEISDESARKNLRQELWRIRKSLAGENPTTDYLLADEYTVTFNRNSDYWLDATQLERPDLEIESLTSNLSLYQGELLPGFFDDWIVLERERIQTIFETKMEQLLNQLVSAERWIAVQEQAERWLALGNTPEPAYRALMLAHGARGDIAKVSAVYQRCMTDLDEKLGLEPSPETRALYDGLLKGTQTPARVTGFQYAGTITFLFTDIEESTNLLDKLGDQYTAVLAEHHQIMRAAIQKWNGHEVDTQGDAFFVTFTRAMDAIQCAAEAQKNFASHKWLHDRPLRVRMGLHTGEPLIASTGYVGMDVHRAARIGDSAHGGQVLLSHTTRELVINDIPQGLSVRDLGEYRLKDMKFPTPIYQLVVEGLKAEFPPLRTKFSGTEAPTPGEPPFKGLQYFDEIDSDLFFGREVLTAKLVNRLRESQFLSVIIGASGSGKSSVVRAGVIPTLKKGITLLDGCTPPEGSVDWRMHILTPTAHPLEALAVELTRESESVTAAATFMDDLMQDPRSLGLFLARQTPKQHTLLVLDQFEELFTLCRDEFEREAFIDNLLTALSPSSLTPLPSGEGNLTLILTLRADFYAHLAQYPELREAVAHQQEYIGPMTTEELRRAIEEPAKRAHWAFEPGLVDLILRDVGDEPGALPLLSHALLETWKRRAGHTLTLKGYADAGGVRGAISHTAESVYQNLSTVEQTIARNIFLRLTELGEGTEDTRRRASFDELMLRAEDADGIQRVLNLLAEARLITLGENSAEVAHEALIREWHTLREWLNQDREGLRLHRNITEATQEWELLEHDAGTLYRGTKLSQAREWAALHLNALNAVEKAFLDASDNLEKQEQAEREAQQRREVEAAQKLAQTERQSASRLRTRNRIITTVASVAVILALLAGMLGLQSNQNAITAQNNAATAQIARDNALNAEATAEAERLRAENEKQLATSRELALAANSNLSVDPELSILLALQALSAADTREAREALHQSVQASRMVYTHPEPIQSVVYSPDGTRMAVGGEDGFIRILDAETKKEIFRFAGNDDKHNWEIKFSPDGKRLAAANDGPLVTVWDAASGEVLFTLYGHTNFVADIAFSPDGRRIATGSEDFTARIWDADTGEELLHISDHTDVVSKVGFSPDGNRLITASWDSTVKIRDAETGEVLLNLTDDVGLDGAFNPDGTRFITGTGDGVGFRMWDVATGQELFAIAPDNIATFVFSADGTRLITGSQNGTIEVWDATSGEGLLTIPTPYRITNWGTFDLSLDGKYIVAVSPERTLRMWDISIEGSRESFTLVGLTGRLPRVEYSPDGTRIATAGPDNTALIWDSQTGEKLVTLIGHTDTVVGIAFSPDGKRLATSSRDNTARIWDAASGKELLKFSKAGHGEGAVGGLNRGLTDVAFSPNGEWLATAGTDGTAILWDAVTGQTLLTVSNPLGFYRVAFSPDGRRLVTSGGNPDENGNSVYRVWDIQTGKELFSMGTPNFSGGIAFSPDATRIVTSGFGGIVKMWDAMTGMELFRLEGHTGAVPDVEFSPNGSIIATASGDGTARLWDASTGKELLTLYGHTGVVSGVAFSPDGTRLVTASNDGTARVYLLNIDELIALAKSRVTRSLTTEECQKYLHMETCPASP
jgi:WD40 repeat protein/DNA-binding SARP family transcriptional activator